MKKLFGLMMILSMNLSQAMAFSQKFTDQMAIDEGMTEISDIEAEFYKKNVMQTANPTNKNRSQEIEQVKNLAEIVIVIDKRASGKDAQTLKVFQEGVEVFQTKVSTGSEQMVTSTSGKKYLTTTPVGNFRPTKIYTDYLSFTWNAPMPNPVFFIGGIAIHATSQANYSKLGTRASGGCVRTTLKDSEYIRDLVLGTGKPTYVIRREAKGRDRVTGGTTKVAQVDRYKNQLTNISVDSWDTIIKVMD